MSKITFGTVTPEQIADRLKDLPNDKLLEVLSRLKEHVLCVAVKELAKQDQEARIEQQARVRLKEKPTSIAEKIERHIPLTQEEWEQIPKAWEPFALREAQLEDIEPFKNPQGHLCGLCDSTSKHEHPQKRCKLCGVSGLAENMERHVCKPAEVRMAEMAAGAYSELTQRLEQVNLNNKWLIDRIDNIHEILCAGQLGTWQERAIQAGVQARKIVDACQPLIFFIDQWERKPLAKQADQFYGIHNGTEYEANLSLEMFRKIRSLLKGK